MTRLDRTALLMLLAALLITAAALALWHARALPLGVACSQPDGCEQITLLGEMLFSFSAAVDAPRAEQAFWMQPPVPARWLWLDERRVRWQAQQPLQGGVTYRFGFSAAQAGKNGQPLAAAAWQAAARTPLALYRSAEGALWTADPVQPDSARRWTQTGEKVAARQPLAFGGEAVFAVENDAGGSDLWRIGRGEDTARLLLKCAAEECVPLAWSPRGDILLYLRAAPGAADGEAYLLDISSGQSTALFANGQRVGYGAAWSPDGGWLAVRDERQAGIRVLALNGEAAFFVPSAGGGAGCWAESGGRLYLYFDDLARGVSSFRGVIRRLEMPSGAVETVAGGATDRIGFSYKSPVCRPFAQGAFVVSAQPDPRVPGAQLWLMDAEGRRQAVILEGFDLVPGSLAWRPDGGALLYHVFALPGGAAQGEVRAWNLNGTGETLRLAGAAAFPVWLP